MKMLGLLLPKTLILYSIYSFTINRKITDEIKKLQGQLH
jgi:hypothetical protein